LKEMGGGAFAAPFLVQITVCRSLATSALLGDLVVIAALERHPVGFEIL
jgi:hypothetical protein